MTDDMKLILQELNKMNQRMDTMQDDLNGKMDAMQDDLNGKMDAMQDDLNGKMDAMQDDLNGKIDAMQDDLNNKITDLQKSNANIQLLIENDISKKINLIGDGHDFLKMKVNEALKMEEKWEGIGLEQIDQRVELNKLKEHLGIA